MKTNTIASIALALLCGAPLLEAQDFPEMPQPTKEHDWLKQFVGEWESDVEIYMVPDQPPMKVKGSETARMVGGFWMVAEGKGEMMDVPFRSVLTLGYDPEKKNYIGTWVDSMSTYLWKYTGSVDSTGKILTLETEGPCMSDPKKMCKYKEVTEFKSKDHRVFTSSVQGEDGEWRMVIKVDTRRKAKE